MIKIAPSILSADFGILAEEIARVEAAGADQIHIDVMDGRFVPNISMGFPILDAIRKRTRLPLDLHLMIVEPEKYLPEFAARGADMLTVHVEACPHLQRTLVSIRELAGKRGAPVKAGAALNPATPLLDARLRDRRPRSGAGDVGQPRLRGSGLHPRRLSQDPPDPLAAG